MLIQFSNIAIHPMHVCSVLDVSNSDRRMVSITLVNGEVIDGPVNKQQFLDMWIDALTWWTARPQAKQNEPSEQMQALMNKLS